MPEFQFDSTDRLGVTAIRTLAMDAVQKANSGHPGAPMGLAPVAYALWQKFLRYDPADPLWPNRDRFLLSNGHASMLQYALIHLAGVRDVDWEGQEVKPTPSLPMDELQRFRQLGSRTPGHPEHELTAGVETTTGPLGQGDANAVGMAIAQKWLQATYGKPGFEDLFAHRVYAVTGDGCMMEGITSEAASLAGHLRLDNLCWIYDDNSITIDGKTAITFTEDTYARFAAYGWHVIRVADGNDLPAIARALAEAEATKGKPTFIGVKTVIAYGAPHKQGTKEAHGTPLGADEIKAAKTFYGADPDKSFFVPPEVYAAFQAGVGKRGADAHAAWDRKFTEYQKQHPDLAEQILLMRRRELPKGWDKNLPTFPADAKGKATRESGGEVINAVAKTVPWLVGGSADLNESTKTFLKDQGVFEPGSFGGRNLHFGVREHAMGGVMNGLTSSGPKAFGAGFLIFSDYGRPAIRLAALMRMPVVYVFTHDSIGVGEDGPTHQPIEQLTSLRAIPGLVVIRPGDANEVTEAWRALMPLKHAPAVLALSRQAMPTFDRTKFAPAGGLHKGGYTLIESGGTPDVILIGTGTEVHLCVEAYETLHAEGVKVRVVSLPCWQFFDQQDQAYRDSVLPPKVTARVTVEMGSVYGWERYAGNAGERIGMHTFGASAPLKDVTKHFGFTAEKVVEAARRQLQRG